MSEQLLTDIGRRIWEGRKLLNYSQETIAELTDLSKQTISSAENGQQELKATNIVKIAQTLDMSVDYLLNGKRTEYDLYLMDKRALGLSDRQFNYFKRVYLDFLELCKQGEIE